MAQKKTKDQAQREKKGRKAGWIAFGVTAVLYAVCFPIRSVGGLLLGTAVSCLIGKVVSIMGTGLDLTTRNKGEASATRPEEVEELPLSGNEAVDAMITQGQEMLRQIRAENDAIPDQALSGQMDELERICVRIFKTLAEKPAKAPQIRKFMNYYLPTTLKMLSSYRTMSSRGVSAEDINEAHATVVRGMGMVLTACQKQLDNLYKDDFLDVSTDIDVLEQMLKRDGFTDVQLAGMPSTAQQPTAAATQMQATDPPQLGSAAKQESDDFVSFYSHKRKN